MSDVTASFETDAEGYQRITFTDGKLHSCIAFAPGLVPRKNFEAIAIEVRGGLQALINRRERRPMVGLHPFGASGDLIEVDWESCKYLDEVG